MKTQSEFINLQNGTTYNEQYFQTQTKNRITIQDWEYINNMIQEITNALSDRKKVRIDYKIIEE